MSSVQLISEVKYHNKTIAVYELKEKEGTTAIISNYGCILMSLVVKDKNGNARDVVLGFDKIEDYLDEKYLEGYPYFGAIIGRYANRIKDGSFSLNGKYIQLAQNNGTSTLHGGAEGFDKKIWDIVQIKSTPYPSLVMEYKSKDGEEGFPGTLTTTISFRLLQNELQYEITAFTDATTIINFTHHSYFNLDKNHSSVHEQHVRINANNWLQQDDEFCVTGHLNPVENSPYDFNSWQPVSQPWNKQDGYDQTFVISKSGDLLRLAAEAKSSDESLHMKVFTTLPVVHFYTGKWIPEIKGKKGSLYKPFCAYCFETQHYPNAVNIPHFPNTLLNPGEVYLQKNCYRFL